MAAGPYFTIVVKEAQPQILSTSRFISSYKKEFLPTFLKRGFSDCVRFTEQNFQSEKPVKESKN